MWVEYWKSVHIHSHFKIIMINLYLYIAQTLDYMSCFANSIVGKRKRKTESVIHSNKKDIIYWNWI